MGYGIYCYGRRQVNKMPTIPEHEEVCAVNDVWDNEFRMLERMSYCFEEETSYGDNGDLALYDLVWDKDFCKLVPCAADEDNDFDHSPNIILEADQEQVSRNLAAILESFERQESLSDDDDEEEEDFDILRDAEKNRVMYVRRIPCDVANEEQKAMFVAQQQADEPLVQQDEDSLAKSPSSSCRTQQSPAGDISAVGRTISAGGPSANQKVF